jgi:3-methylfumaryl-CoA hydratase
MLDQPESSWTQGDPAPLGWHFPLLGANVGRRTLRGDGFPGLGISLPDLALPRLVAAGRKVTFHSPIYVEEPIERESSINSISEKETATGKIAIVTALHAIKMANAIDAAIEEEQTYVMLSARHSDRKLEPWKPPTGARLLGQFTPDDTLLFQFSALSFNSHRIHLDRDFAREAEGYPDLVVNGGITTLLMTEHARREFRLASGTITVTNKIPLFANRPITFMADHTSTGPRIVTLDADGVLAAQMDIQANGV